MLKRLLQFHSETDGEENVFLIKSDRKLHQRIFSFKAQQEAVKHKSLVVLPNLHKPHSFESKPQNTHKSVMWVKM